MAPAALDGIDWEFETFPEFLASRDGRARASTWPATSATATCGGGSWAPRARPGRPPRPRSWRWAQLLAEAMDGRGGRVLLDPRLDPQRRRQPPGAQPVRRARRAAGPGRRTRPGQPGHHHLSAAQRGRRARPRRHGPADRARTGESAAGHHPGSRRPQQGRRPRRRVGRRPRVPGAGPGRRLGRVLAPAGPPVRPARSPSADGTTLYEGVPAWDRVVAPVRRTTAGPSSRTRRSATPCATPWSSPTATPTAGRRCPRRTGTCCSWARSTIPDSTASSGRSIADIAAEQGKAPADAMLDLALADDLATQFRWVTETDGVDGRGPRGPAQPAHDHRHLRRRGPPVARRRLGLQHLLPPTLGARPRGVDARAGDPPADLGAGRPPRVPATGDWCRPATSPT